MDASQSIIYKLCEILYFLTGKLFNKAEEEKGISKFTIIMCGGQKMAPHVNKWSPLDGAHE